MINIGRICVKLAGREAGKKCVVVEAVDDNFVIIDGAVRRKKCNIKHLEPLGETMKISKGASHEEIVKEFKKLGIEIKEKKAKEPKAEKPAKKRKGKEKAATSATALHTAEKEKKEKKAKTKQIKKEKPKKEKTEKKSKEKS
jgi:large subunit ribosomal protein L14e